MGDRVYTERFLTCSGDAATSSYFVPAGMRAVVTSVVVAQSAGNTGTVQVVVGDAVVYQRAVQGTDATTTLSMRCVAYGGELVYAFTAVPGIYVTVGGYLFEDSTHATGPPQGAGQKPNPGPLELGELQAG